MLGNGTFVCVNRIGMAEITDMERNVLEFIRFCENGVSGPDVLIEEARPVFASLVQRGFIEQVYVVSERGHDALSSGQTAGD